MLLIIEIILTAVAWRRGWRGYALLPLGIGIVLGIIIGLSITSNGIAIEDCLGTFIIFDVLAIIALIVMIVKAPETKTIEQTSTADKKIEDLEDLLVKNNK